MKNVAYLIIFILLSIVGYILIPQQVFIAGYWWLAIPFITLFALVTMCTIRNVRNTYSTKISKKGFVASIFGFSALQVCGLSAYACSTALGFTILATILPHTVLNFFQQHSILIILLSIFIQIYALFQLKCINIQNK
jgi:hypothetical protein